MNYFQIALPADASRITGVQTAATRFSDSPPVTTFSLFVSVPPPVATIDPLFIIEKNHTIGRLTLQTPGGIFYQEDVRQEDWNTNQADFMKTDLFLPQVELGRRYAKNTISITACSPVIEGFYKDSWGVFDTLSIGYTLSIYIWIEKRTTL